MQLPRWFPLYGAILVVATLTPFWPTCATTAFAWRLNPFDIGQNVLLFVPLGFALHRTSRARLALLALLVSGSIEFLQTHLPRTPGALDVVANTFGALLGRSLGSLPLADPWPRRWRVIAVGTASLLLCFTVVASLRLAPNDFSNWEHYRLVIGNEVTGNRPWLGEIAELAVFDRALEEDPAPTGASGPPSWLEGGPILWLSFVPPVRAYIDGPEGRRALEIPDPMPAGLTLGQNLSVHGGGWQLPDWVARVVGERLSATGQLTVAANVRAAARDATGPTRILSFSQDTRRRNFTLGQFDANLVLRVRTPNSNENAAWTGVRTAGDPLTMQFQRVLAAFHGPYGRIFVNGRCYGEQLYPLIYAGWLLGRGIALTILGCCVAAALAAASLASHRPHGRWIGFVLGGAGAWAILRLAGSWAQFPSYDGIAAAVAVIGLVSAAPLLRGMGESA